MARTPTKTTSPAPEPMVNGEALQRLDNSSVELVHIEEAHSQHVIALATQLNYQGQLSIGALEDGIRFYHQRTAEACMELGKRLILLKEATPHGEFKNRVELLGIDPTASKRFMAAAAKFSKGATSHLLAAANSQSKLIELLVLDDTEIAELEDGGTVRGITVDKIDTMGVRDLRAALRQSEKDADFSAEKRQKAEARADAAEKKLRGKTPVVVPLDERITPFQVEITERQSLLEKALAAHHESVIALEAWWNAEDASESGSDEMPRSVQLVLLHLDDAVNRTAQQVGALQNEILTRFGQDIDAARQYLLQQPEAGNATA